MNLNFFSFNFLRLLCHQLPERSPAHCPVCYRCFGIYLGFLMSEISRFLLGAAHINKFITIVFIIPIAIDGLLQYLTRYESNNKKRLATGWLAGIATSLASSNSMEKVFYSNHNSIKAILLAFLFSAAVLFILRKASGRQKKIIYYSIVAGALLLLAHNIFIIAIS